MREDHFWQVGTATVCLLGFAFGESVLEEPWRPVVRALALAVLAAWALWMVATLWRAAWADDG